METKIAGFKVFDKNWKCQNFQFEVGKEYIHTGELSICNSGFHFCKKVNHCFNYKSFDPANKIAEVIAFGRVEDQNDKSVTDKILIVREISWNEMLVLANTGSNNSGHSNSGDFNSGNRNSGDFNSGNRNSGFFNSGDFNSGNRNSGDFNSGHSNSGHSNSGNRNSGDFNSGNRNSGDFNSGHSNSGDFNSGNRNSGFFNTVEFNVMMFNKDSGKKYNEINIPYFLKYLPLNTWISFSDMTDDEKISYPKAFVADGYLKKREFKEACIEVFKKASAEDIESVKALPNFDSEIFFQVTGVRI